MVIESKLFDETRECLISMFAEPSLLSKKPTLAIYITSVFCTTRLPNHDCLTRLFSQVVTGTRGTNVNPLTHPHTLLFLANQGRNCMWDEVR